MGVCEEWNGNVGNQCGYARNLGGNPENMVSQWGDAGNQGGNLSIAVELT